MAFRSAPYYDVFYPVGPGCPNHRTDVQLVQYFLFAIYMNSGWNVAGRFNVGSIASPAAIFPCSGQYTPELSVWIKNFQSDASGQGYGPLFVDGKVNSARKLWGNKSASGSWYTILAFNQILIESDKERFLNLAQDKSMPAELRSDLETLTLHRA